MKTKFMGNMGDQQVGERLNFQGTFKTGRVFPNRWGTGLFGELANFYYMQKLTFLKGNTGTYYTSVNKITVAAPQATIGVELYKKVFVSRRSYLRFGLLVGYVQAYGSQVISRREQVSGIGTGFRYHSCYFKRSYTSRYNLETASIPFTIGLNHKFAGTPRKADRFYEAGAE